MRLILFVTLLSLSFPRSAEAGFDTYFGDYTVVEAPINLTCPSDSSPKVLASISRKFVNKYLTIVLDVNGSGVDCSFRYASGLSVQEMPGITCIERDHQLQCTDGSNTSRFDAWTAADGTVRIQGVQTGASSETRNWVLRRI